MANFDRFITAGEVVRRVLAIQGLPKIENVSSSNDATARQMWALLTECGQELLDKSDWETLVRTYTFTTGTGVEYPMPPDIQRFLNETGWNNTSRFPLAGPVGRQVWRMLQARQLGGTTMRLQYVIEGDKLKFYFAPNPAQSISIDYISRGWIQDATSATTFKDKPDVDADIVLYQPDLMVAMLRTRWRETKGFDTSASEARYRAALTSAKINDRPARDLDMASRASGNLISVGNLPDTRYGV
jgi:hypothetical protein